MQLSARHRGVRTGAPARGGAGRPAAAALWLAGLGTAHVACAGVLPEDRFDALYHRYEGGGISIQGPSVLIRKKVGNNFAFTAGYYEDMISSASIDVKLSASPYHEQRKQENASIEFLHGKSTYSVGVIHSAEPDYKSWTTFYSVSQDMFGDLTTVSLGYRRGWDKVYRDVKVNGVLQNDPSFRDIADHRGYSVGLTQILTRNMMLVFNYEALTDQGYLASPYRKILYVDPTSGLGFSLADQIYPRTRTSNAASLQVKEYLPWRAALTGKYRWFSDTWGIVGHTFELDYTQPWHRWTFDGRARYYRQRHADFYADIFPRANYANFMARDRELATFHSIDIGIGASYEFAIPGVPHVTKASIPSTFNVRFDHLIINYADFRNALVTKNDPTIKEQSDPLYTLDANILEAFISLMF